MCILCNVARQKGVAVCICGNKLNKCSHDNNPIDARFCIDCGTSLSYTGNTTRFNNLDDIPQYRRDEDTNEREEVMYVSRHNYDNLLRDQETYVGDKVYYRGKRVIVLE